MNEPNLQSDASRSRDSKSDLDLLARALPPTANVPANVPIGNIEDHLPTTRMPSIAPPLPPVRPPPVVRPIEKTDRTEQTVKVARAAKLEKPSAARASLHDGWVALRTRASFVTLRHTLGGAYAFLGAALLVTSFVVGLFASHGPSDASGTSAAIVLARAVVALGGMAIGYALLASARSVLLSRKAPRRSAVAERV